MTIPQTIFADIPPARSAGFRGDFSEVTAADGKPAELARRNRRGGPIAGTAGRLRAKIL
jgi:hypothetical protein